MTITPPSSDAPVVGGETRELLAFLAEAAARTAADGTKEPLVKGTFAMYAMDDGGVMFAAHVAEGPMAGTHHHRIPAGLVRAAAGIATGTGGKVALLKGLFKR